MTDTLWSVCTVVEVDGLVSPFMCWNGYIGIDMRQTDRQTHQGGVHKLCDTIKPQQGEVEWAGSMVRLVALGGVG